MAEDKRIQDELFGQEQAVVRKCTTCTRPADRSNKKQCTRCREESSRRSKARQDKLVAEGNCCSCGKPRQEASVRYCDACRAYYSGRNRDRAKKRAAVKLCQGCEKPNSSRSLHCDECRAFMRSKTAKMKIDAKERGACIQCDAPLDSWQSICAACRQRLVDKSNDLKRRAFALYGGACNCCGETELSFLTLDHVNDDGAVQRREKKHPSTGKNLYRWIIRHGKQDDQQVLCWSCQWGKRICGVCPHKTRGVMQGDGEGI